MDTSVNLIFIRNPLYFLCQFVLISVIHVSNFVVLAFGRIFDELNSFSTK